MCPHACKLSGVIWGSDITQMNHSVREIVKFVTDAHSGFFLPFHRKIKFTDEMRKQD